MRRARAWLALSAGAALAAPALAWGAEDAALDDRRRPGLQETFPAPIEQTNPGAIETPPPEAFPADQFPVPDRWRLADTLGVKTRWFDPYNQNMLKGDRPLPGTQDWFIQLNGVSDTVIEPRSFPTPVGVQTTSGSGSLDVYGGDDSLVAVQTVLFGGAIFQGSTAFKPPDFEARVALALQANYVRVKERRLLSVRSSNGLTRKDAFLGVQEAFVDKHLRNVSARYDFDSLRIGIQPFNSDFRGFLFQDVPIGFRLFGNRDNNHYQYNFGLFARLEKDTNSGLNDLGQDVRRDYVAAANLYRQDFPVPGLTSQVSLIWNANREGGEIQVDDNGFPVRPALIGNLRPRDYDVAYLGYNADGRIGRVNLTASAWAAFGRDRDSIFTGKPTDIRAFFLAAEPSIDMSWARVRGSFLYASGDSDPYDGRETGFDAILENPQFAGADTSYWIRQAVPFAGGGRAIGIAGRNGVLNSLRSSKEEGQSNFNNPGTVLIGAGADLDLLPTLRVSGNINRIAMADSAVVETLRQQGDVPEYLGMDYSAAAIWRPLMTQNVVFRFSGAVFDPGEGFGSLLSGGRGRDRYYSVLLNAVLTY